MPEATKTNPGSDGAFALRVVAGLILVIGLIVTLFFVFVAIFMIPVMTEIFQEFDAQLPRSTLLLIRVPWLGLLVSIPTVLVAGAGIIRANRLLPVLAAILLLVSVGVAAFYYYAISIPLITLIQSVSSGI